MILQTYPYLKKMEWLYGVQHNISVILQQPLHISMLSWSSFNQYSMQYSFQAAFPHNQSGERGMNPVAIISSILWKNIAQAGDWTSDLLFSFLQRYRLSYGARLYLTLYHTITTFNDPEKEAFWKHCGKRRKCWWPAFSPFPTMFSTNPKKNFCF